MEKISYEQYRDFLNRIDPKNNCPIQMLIGTLAKKWNLRVIFELTKRDVIRFGELRTQVGEIAATSLSSTLKELEENGFVERIQYNEIPPRVEYSLTEKGKMLYPVFVAMGDWCQKYQAED